MVCHGLNWSMDKNLKVVLVAGCSVPALIRLEYAWNLDVFFAVSSVNQAYFTLFDVCL
jgi:hypothetical protein